MTLDKRVEAIDALRTKYPDETYREVFQEIVSDLLVRYEKHKQFYKDKYNATDSFTEKKRYFDGTFSEMKKAYPLIVKRLKTIQPLPYEYWVNENELRYMQKVGFKRAVEQGIIIGYNCE